MTDLNLDQTVMSIDGIGANDHVFRHGMLPIAQRASPPRIAPQREGVVL